MMRKKELSNMSKEELVEILRTYGDDEASTSMRKSDLIESLINYEDAIEDLFPNNEIDNED